MSARRVLRDRARSDSTHPPSNTTIDRITPGSPTFTATPCPSHDAISHCWNPTVITGSTAPTPPGSPSSSPA